MHAYRQWRTGDGPPKMEYFLGALGARFMVSTRLEDLNGREIFEGDIVRCFGFVGVVRCTMARFDVVFSDRGYENLSRFGRGADVTVLGNIYENPELLDEHGIVI